MIPKMELDIHRILHFHEQDTVLGISDRERITEREKLFIDHSLYFFLEPTTIGCTLLSITSCTQSKIFSAFESESKPTTSYANWEKTANRYPPTYGDERTLQ